MIMNSKEGQQLVPNHLALYQAHSSYGEQEEGPGNIGGFKPLTSGALLLVLRTNKLNE